MTKPSPSEELLKFPTSFPIKIMGFSQENFPSAIANAIHEIVPDFNQEAMKISYSKEKKYMALAVTIEAQSKEQLDTIYKMLTSHPMVKVVL